MKKILIVLSIIFIIITTGCSPQEYEVNIEVEPEGAGKVVGEGKYEAGEEMELAAISKEGYDFTNWEVDGEIVFENQILDNNIEEEYNFVANFEKKEKKKHSINLNDLMESKSNISEKELDEKIEKLDILWEEQNWEEIAEVLKTLFKYNRESTSKYSEIISQFQYGPNGENLLINLKQGKVLTKPNLEEIDWQDIKPKKPTMDILKREPLEIYRWFYNYENFINKFSSVKFTGVDQQEKLIMTEDAAKFLQELASEYKSREIDLNYYEIDIIDSKFYIFANMMGGMRSNIIDDKAEEIQIEVTEKKIILKIKDYVYKSKTILEEIKEYTTIEVDYIKKDDGTFRVEKISLVE
ncbi:MAG: InlB B-repeat-containing protein [bacterium]